jgi:hypothetical protein
MDSGVPAPARISHSLHIPGNYYVTEDILNLSIHIYTFRKADLEFASKVSSNNRSECGIGR